MQKEDIQFFKKLLSVPSPSGFERNASREWKKYTSGFADEVRSDFHGNAFAGINIKSKHRIMLSGHIDELGFIISYISDKGYVFFRPIGGHDKCMVSGRGVFILNSKAKIYGVTGKKAIHLMTPEERKKVPEFDQMWIDIGVQNREDALKLVAIGDPIVYDVDYKELKNDLVASRAFDNKAGAFAVALSLKMIEKEKIQNAVFAVATVQEEVGIRGAKTSAYSLDPQIGIAVDVTHATDHPDVDPKKFGDIQIGHGPVILRGANSNQLISDLLIRCAEEHQIPFQIEAQGGGTGTDANAIQVSRGSVATGLVSIPLRYMHTPREVIHLEDLKNTAKLLSTFVKRVSNVDHFVLD